MEQLEKVVIRAINWNLGLPESDTEYDSRVLADKIRQITTRIVVPKIPTREFAEFLEKNDGVSKFVKKCIHEWNMASAMIFHALLAIQGNDTDRITPFMIAKQFPGSPYIPILWALVASQEITIWGLKEAHEIAIAWHHKKLSGYVAEFWNQVRNKRNTIIHATIQETDKYRQLLPPGADAKTQTSYVGSILQASLIGFSYTLKKLIEMDPEFDMWTKVDGLLNPSRLQTLSWQKEGRANTVIKVWVGAGVDVASGYLETALEKCQMDKWSALALYRHSYGELFATIGMMDHPFISAFSELIKRPKTVRAMAEPLRAKDTPRMMNIFMEAHNDTLNIDVSLAQEMLKTGSAASIIFAAISDRKQYPFCTDFFEITPDGKLRVKQWMIDFVKLMNANSSIAVQEKIHGRGCPMMHGKTRPEEGNMVFMEDFAHLFAETMEAYWQK